MPEIKYTCQCDSCEGTGLYVGMAERDGAAVVCNYCNGSGKREITITYKDFTGKKERKDIKRVYQTNPGIVIGSDNGCKLEDFGGISYKDWENGKGFPKGSEMRKYACPRWWGQCAGGEVYKKAEKLNCKCWGRRFCECEQFSYKAACWEEFDKIS